jgi:hypothetical protein
VIDGRFGFRLEDCTGRSLGTLPQDDEYEDESEDESGDERSDDDNDDEDSWNGYLNLMKRSLNGGGGFPHSRKATVVPWN